MTVLDIYTRVSRKADERQLSVRGQAKHCAARVREIGATVGEVFTDDGKSAWNPRTIRPDWERLMARLEAGESDGVIIYDLSRFTRNHKDALRIAEAAERGVAILDSDKAWDLTDPDTMKQFWDLVTANRYFSALTSKKTRRGKEIRAQDGLNHGGPRAFGFEPDGMTIRESEAEVIRELADRMLKGESQGELTADLNARGIRTATGAEWTRASMRAVLRRERNAGILIHNGEPVAELPGKPILDRETYDALDRMFSARKRGRPVAYLCSGSAVCGACGHGLTGRPRPHHHAYEDGEPKREYWCSPANGGCGGVHIDIRILDGWAGEWAVRELSDPEHADAVARREAEFSARRAELEAEVSAIESMLDDLNSKHAAELPAAVKAGRVERVRKRHKGLTEPLEERLGSISAELAELTPENTLPAPSRTIPDRDAAWIYWLDRWTAGKTGEKRQILRHALDGRRIVVSPGRGTERVSVALNRSRPI